MYLSLNFKIFWAILMTLGVKNGPKIARHWCWPGARRKFFRAIFAYLWPKMGQILIFKWYTPPLCMEYNDFSNKMAQNVKWAIFDEFSKKWSYPFFANFTITENASQATIFEPQPWNFTGTIQTYGATKLLVRILVFGPKNFSGHFY